MHLNCSRLSFLLAFLFSANCGAESNFIPVFVDARTEARTGPFPFDRSITASALLAFEKLGAKGVVIKFFLDQPKGHGDDQLAAAIEKLPTILQARCDDTEAKPNSLEERFYAQPAEGAGYAASCKAGWIPLPVLQKNAANVCFIDQSVADVAPIQERYQGRPVRTLYSCALELAHKSVPKADGSGTTKVDLRKAPLVAPVSLVDVLDEKVNRGDFSGKIVILGYDGSKAPMIDTPIGRLSAHRAFMANLLVLENTEN